MSDHYIPPPPTYELSQQGHDQKIPDQLQASFVVPKTPIGKVNEEDDEYGQDHVDNTSASKELQYQAAFFQPLQIKKRSPSGNGAQRSSRPLPPNPAEAHAYNRQVNSSPHGHHYLPEKAQSHNAYHYGAPPFSAGSPYTHNSVPISPISNSAHAPFDAPPNFHGGSRPFKPNQRSEQASSFYPRASQFGFQNALSSSTRNPPTRVNFDPSVAYANSLSQHSAHSNEHRAVDPAALYSSAVSSHLHPSSATTNSQYPYPGNKIRASAQFSAFAENLDLPDRPPSASSFQSYASCPSYPTQPQRTAPYPRRPRSTNGPLIHTDFDFSKDLYRS